MRYKCLQLVHTSDKNKLRKRKKNRYIGKNYCVFSDGENNICVLK